MRRTFGPGISPSLPVQRCSLQAYPIARKFARIQGQVSQYSLPIFAHYVMRRSQPPVAWSSSGARGKKLNAAHPVWQEGIGSLLLLAAAQQTGLLEALVKAVIEVADPTIPGLRPLNRAVVEGLVLTLLFLPVAGLARTWDLRSYTGTMLARLCGRERAYSQRYTERFLAKLAHTGAAERLTQGVARWTWSLWQTEQASPDQPSLPTVFYVHGHRKAVDSDVLVPRGPAERSWAAANWWCYTMPMGIRGFQRRIEATTT